MYGSAIKFLSTVPSYNSVMEDRLGFFLCWFPLFSVVSYTWVLRTQSQDEVLNLNHRKIYSVNWSDLRAKGCLKNFIILPISSTYDISAIQDSKTFWFFGVSFSDRINSYISYFTKHIVFRSICLFFIFVFHLFLNFMFCLVILDLSLSSSLALGG